MVSDARSIFLAGVGAAAMTYEKANEVVNSLVEKGKITVDEGMELSRELKRTVKEGASDVKQKASEAIEHMRPLTKDDLMQVLEQSSFASKGEILELKERIEALEGRQLNSNNNSLT